MKQSNVFYRGHKLVGIKLVPLHTCFAFSIKMGIVIIFFHAFLAIKVAAADFCGNDVNCYMEKVKQAIIDDDIDAAIKALEAAQRIQPLPERDDRLKRLKALRNLFFNAKSSTSKPASQRWLFQGQMTDSWQPYASAGGNFKKFAKIKKGVLEVEVPAGNNWGKTGIASRVPLLLASSKRVQKLTFSLLSRADDGYVISFVPQSSHNQQDEWWAHEFRIGLGKQADKQELSLFVRREKVDSLFIAPGSLAKLQVLRFPDGEIVVRDQKDRLLLQGVMPDEAVHSAFRILVLAHAPKAGKPAHLALKDILLEELPWEKLPEPDAFLLQENELTLFANGRLGRLWSRYNAAGGDFSRHARLSEDGLVVEVPPKSWWGMVGICSPQPLVWLDNFGKGAEQTLMFSFDPVRTTGFTVAFIRHGVINGNDPGYPSLIFHWRKTVDGRAHATLTKDLFKKTIFDVITPPDAPKSLLIHLTPVGMIFQAPGLPQEPIAWNELKEGTGIRLMVYSQPDKAGQPVKMALSKITLRRRPGAPLQEPKPAPGVPPLPVKTFFNGSPGEWFEPAAVGFDAKQCAHYQDRKLVADVKANVNWWGKCGLISSKPIKPFNVDRRIHQAFYRLTWKFDPKATSGIQVMFADGKYPAMWPKKFMYFSFIRAEKGPRKGNYVLDLGGNGAYSRTVDGEWVKKHWDGRIIMEFFSNKWLRIRLPGGPSIRDYWNKFLYGGYMTVYAHPSYQNGGAHMELEKITGQWVAPEGMTRIQRWCLLDDEEFNVDAFIDDMRKQINQ